MATTGTTALEVRAALVDLLADRLTDVSVSYGQPRDAADLTDDTGAQRAVWLEGVIDASAAYPVIVAGPKPTQEEYRFAVVVQCSGYPADDQVDPQITADADAVALWQEIHSCIAEDPSVGVDRVTATPAQWSLTPLPPAATGWGARVDAVISVSARILPPS